MHPPPGPCCLYPQRPVPAPGGGLGTTVGITVSGAVMVGLPHSHCEGWPHSSVHCPYCPLLRGSRFPCTPCLKGACPACFSIQLPVAHMSLARRQGFGAPRLGDADSQETTASHPVLLSQGPLQGQSQLVSPILSLLASTYHPLPRGTSMTPSTSPVCLPSGVLITQHDVKLSHH